jgi:hypothetical protein
LGDSFIYWFYLFISDCLKSHEYCKGHFFTWKVYNVLGRIQTNNHKEQVILNKIFLQKCTHCKKIANKKKCEIISRNSVI